jgi:hypothetical protein
MTYKRSSKSLIAIGSELGVNYLVESSIRAEHRSGRLSPSGLASVSERIRCSRVGSVHPCAKHITTVIVAELD